MPNTRSAAKALRSSMRRKVFNDRRRAALRSVEKAMRLRLAEKKFEEARALLPRYYQTYDKAAKTGVIVAKTASRKKSRATRRLAAFEHAAA